MAKEKVVAKDLFLQFFDLVVTSDAADSTTGTGQDFPTGLSLRGGLAWLLHMVQFYAGGFLVGCAELHLAMSTDVNLVACPYTDERGTIEHVGWAGALAATDGAHSLLLKNDTLYAPPIPLAAPNVSMWCETETDAAGMRGLIHHGRIGYTTVPLDAPMFQELAEVWGW